MPEPNESRRLAPDTKWILTTVGAVFVGIVSITQYQINSAAELTLERARSEKISISTLTDALRPRDERIRVLEEQMTNLREERAKIAEGVANIGKTMERIVDVTIQTQSRASETEGQLKQLLNQTAANQQLVAQLVDRHRTAAQTVSERLTRLESERALITPSGTP